MKILEVNNVSKSFDDKQVLEDVSFTLDYGECLGIVGRSGCGKSTLARLITKFIETDKGEIYFEGENLVNLKSKELYKRMQMVFQMPEESFNPRKTLGWSISEPLRNYNFDNVNDRVRSLLNEVGLSEEFIERYPSEVSGGQCQRAAIARAISLTPKLLICDEATSALDSLIQSQVVKLLKKLCTEKKIAMIFITHNLALLSKIADRVIVMHSGKIVEEGITAKIISNSQSKYTKELIEANFF